MAAGIRGQRQAICPILEAPGPIGSTPFVQRVWGKLISRWGEIPRTQALGHERKSASSPNFAVCAQREAELMVQEGAKLCRLKDLGLYPHVSTVQRL
jgi:hypothetical protein